MRDHYSYEYAVIRVVPRVEREEFVNVGIIVWCRARELLEAKVEIEPHRLTAIDPTLDLAVIQTHLDAISTICKGGSDAGSIGKLSPRERFDWLTAPRSAVIQTSSVHTGRCTDLGALLENLLGSMVRLPSA